MNTPRLHRRNHKAVTPFEPLEQRTFMSATVSAQIPAQTVVAGQTFAPLALGQFFTDNAVPAGDTVVNIQTSLPAPDNSIPVILTNAATPQTVANFLNYINSGEYANTIVHRSVPGFVIQAGGYTTGGTHISTFGTIPGESSTETLKNNTLGTIAMALSTGPNSATSEWFVNLGNNSVLDGTADGGPFTAFGQTIYNGLTVANDIAALPIVNDASQNGAWNTLPVRTGTNGSTVSSVPSSNLVVLNPIVVPNGLNYSVTSSNPGLVTASVAGGNLALTPVNGGGQANITVTAADLGGGTVSSTFAVNVVNNSPVVTLSAAGSRNAAYTDADGTKATLSLKGAGSLAITFGGSNVTQSTAGKTIDVGGTSLSIAHIVTTGTDGTSVLNITTKGGTKLINIAGLSTQSLKSITGKGVDLTGGITASGSIGTISVAGIAAGALTAQSVGNITTTGDFSTGLTLTAAGADLNNFKAASVSAGTWNIAGSVKSISVKGNFGATVAAGSITTFNVKGSVSGSTITLSSTGLDLKTLTVGAGIASTVIDAIGSLGNLSAANLTSTEIYAGIGNLAPGQLLPNSAAQLVSDQTIGSVKLKSVRGAFSFTNSDIAAANLGTLSLGGLQTSNGGIPTGVAASTIKLLTATANKKFTLKKLSVGSGVSALIAAQGITPGDFAINLI